MPINAFPRALAAAVAFFALTGCGDEKTKESESVDRSESPRTLKEIPTAQLRTVLKGYPGDWRNDSDQSKGIAAPPRTKPIPEGATRIPLTPPDEWKLDGIILRDALASRRSRREFATTPLSADELSFLLWSAQGVTATGRDETAAVTQEFRTAPSGGGRFPLETYLAIHRVEGFEPGIYRYLPNGHELVLIGEDPDIATKTTATCYGQTWVGEAAVVFLWAAVPYRTEWKYAYLSHRMIAIEAGHVCQNVYLAAESIGAGACALLAYDQSSADALIGVDGVEEFVLYLACVGKRSD